MATKKKTSTNGAGFPVIEEYTTEDGVTLRILDNPRLPLTLQRTMSSVRMPKRPTYETKTISGRVEKHPLDEQAAKETPGGEQKWADYQEMLQEAKNEQNERVLRALFLLGIDFDLPKDRSWIQELEEIGLELPDDEKGLKIEYLMTQLSSSDLNAITSKIIESTTGEEEIQKAEESFSS